MQIFTSIISRRPYSNYLGTVVAFSLFIYRKIFARDPCLLQIIDREPKGRHTATFGFFVHPKGWSRQNMSKESIQYFLHAQ